MARLEPSQRGGRASDTRATPRNAGGRTRRRDDCSRSSLSAATSTLCASVRPTRMRAVGASGVRRLPKRFRTARLLGEGAVGTVYEVWDEVRSERLALKTLHKLTGEKASPGAVRGFKQEFRNVASVSHENLVVLHELFFEEELWFFTMELVRGKPFLGTRATAPAARLAPGPLRDRFAQLARGIKDRKSTRLNSS